MGKVFDQASNDVARFLDHVIASIQSGIVFTDADGIPVRSVYDVLVMASTEQWIKAITPSGRRYKITPFDDKKTIRELQSIVLQFTEQVLMLDE